MKGILDFRFQICESDELTAVARATEAHPNGCKLVANGQRQAWLAEQGYELVLAISPPVSFSRLHVARRIGRACADMARLSPFRSLDIHFDRDLITDHRYRLNTFAPGEPKFLSLDRCGRD